MQSRELGKNIAIMGLGTILAQSINVIVQPVLTRVFSASDLGVYTFILSVANILIPITSLKLDMLIVSEKDEEKAQYITDVCVIVNFFVAGLSLFVLVICAVLIPDSPLFQYGMLIFAVPALILTNGLRFLFISYNNRYKEYKLISKLGIVRELSRAIIQVGAGFSALGPAGLLFGYGIAPVLGFRMQMRRFFDGLKDRSRIRLSKLKEIILKDGRKQIMYIMPAQLINSFSSSLVTIMIAALYSSAALGYYSMGVRILDVPIMFIASNVSKVCYQRICESVSKGAAVSRTIIAIALVLALLSALLFSFLYLTAIPLCEFVFGQSYGIAGVYLRCMCVMYAIRLVATSFAGVFTAFNKQGYELLLNVMLVILAFASYAITSMLSADIEVFLTVIGGAYSLMYLLMLVGTIACCIRHDKRVV